MELTLSERDVSNAAFFDPTGKTIYHAISRSKGLSGRKTKIHKTSHFGEREMGHVELNGWSRDIVNVEGHSLTPHRNKLKVFSSSEVFTASDRHSYKWKHKSGHFVLYSKHGSEMIASYDSGSRGFFSKKRPPKLTILPQGLPVVDEIVATLIYMIQKRRQRARSSGAAAAAGASGGGGGGC